MVLVILIILIAIAMTSMKTIHQNHVGLVETLGKYSHPIPAGIHFVMPFFQHVRVVNLATRPLTLPEYVVITKDNAPVSITVSLNYSVTDAKSYTYDNSNSVESMAQIVRGHLRDIIGGMDMDKVLDSSDKINGELAKAIGGLTNNFGLNVDQIYIDDLKPSEDIQDSMNKQMRADKDKTAKTSEAQGDANKIQTENKANNDAMVATAKAKATAIEKEADAEKYRVKRSAEADKFRIQTIQDAMASGNHEAVQMYLENQAIHTYGKLADGSNNMVVAPANEAKDFGRYAKFHKTWDATDENQSKAHTKKAKAE